MGLAGLSALRVGDGVVRLDRFTTEDLEALASGDDDPELRHRFAIPPSFRASVLHSQQVLARWSEEWASGTRFTFAVRPVDDTSLLGGCELRPDGLEKAAVSYWIYPAHRGRGFASRALSLLVQSSFELGSFAMLEAAVDPDNIASARVARRAGFVETRPRDGQRVFERVSGRVARG